mmetsp:Transcript_88269/g.254599  ORF Transcript_88269/g.254599 Transcript_88269/m.254599 type:complete len:205 (+) Transcript_88269:102-716(+)
MSKPREATSVAIRAPRLPADAAAVSSRNFAKASSRTHWSLPLWIARTHRAPFPEPGANFFCKSRSNSSQAFFCWANTIAVSPAANSFFSTSRSLAGFWLSSMTSTRWVTFLFAVNVSPSDPWPIRTCTASLLVRDSAVAWTSFGQVAVKKSVWRCVPASGPEAPKASSGFWQVSGHLPTIVRMSGSKPMSNIRSASSRTKYVTL